MSGWKEGHDIRLNRWNMQDVGRLAYLCNHVDRRFLSGRIASPYTEADAAWWLGMVREQEGSGGIYRAVCVDGAYVGNLSVERKADVYCRDAEIGYFLLDGMWSKGIMTEAVRQICPIAFRELDIVRITGLAYGPNIASQRVLEKNGFVLEGTKRQAVFKDGKLYDLRIYGKCHGPAPLIAV